MLSLSLHAEAAYKEDINTICEYLLDTKVQGEPIKYENKSKILK